MYEKCDRQVERLLRRKRIDEREVKTFSFMKRYTPVTDKHSERNLYGPGILTLHLNDGTERAFILHTRHHPTAVVHYLMRKGIPMDNEEQVPRKEVPQQPLTFRRPSLLLVWQALLSLAFFCLGFYLATMQDGAAGLWLSLPCFVLAIYGSYTLLTRYCYVTLDSHAMQVHSMGRTLAFPYENIRKLNIDFAREQQHTHVLEMLEQNHVYHLYYIGCVPHSRLLELTEALRRAGVDATCSLNPEKRHYYDVYHQQ